MQGLVFIPDITGFTNFVKTIDLNLGVSITRDLLTAIINNNPLELQVSEIEGDAVLFYKVGKPIPLKDIFYAYECMDKAFHSRYQKLKAQYNINTNLSLKVIVHYGNMSVFEINGFNNLYGQTIIESHQLLKNGDGHKEYVLVTEDYLNALKSTLSKVPKPNWGCISFGSQVFINLRSINYYYFKQKGNKNSTMCTSKLNKGCSV